MLEAAIKDYNATWGTSYSTDGDIKFQNYARMCRRCRRMKNKQIDILIVVGMFLTGLIRHSPRFGWIRTNDARFCYRPTAVPTVYIECGERLWQQLSRFRNLKKQNQHFACLFWRQGCRWNYPSASVLRLPSGYLTRRATTSTAAKEEVDACLKSSRLRKSLVAVFLPKNRKEVCQNLQPNTQTTEPAVGFWRVWWRCENNQWCRYAGLHQQVYRLTMRIGQR